MLERFGVQLPSLSSVLSFKVDGMEDCLPLKKVILQSKKSPLLTSASRFSFSIQTGNNQRLSKHLPNNISSLYRVMEMDIPFTGLHLLTS